MPGRVQPTTAFTRWTADRGTFRGNAFSEGVSRILSLENRSSAASTVTSPFDAVASDLIERLSASHTQAVSINSLGAPYVKEQRDEAERCVSLHACHPSATPLLNTYLFDQGFLTIQRSVEPDSHG
jgi:hypothetical protein